MSGFTHASVSTRSRTFGLDRIDEVLMNEMRFNRL
jgi:hypothetical protein